MVVFQGLAQPNLGGASPIALRRVKEGDMAIQGKLGHLSAGRGRRRVPWTPIDHTAAMITLTAIAICDCTHLPHRMTAALKLLKRPDFIMSIISSFPPPPPPRIP